MPILHIYNYKCTMQLSYNVIAQQCNIVYLIYHQQFRYCGTISQAYFSALQRDGSVTVVYQCFIKIILECYRLIVG